MAHAVDIEKMLREAVFIWGQGRVAEKMGVERETVNRWLKKKGIDRLNRDYARYVDALRELLPPQGRRNARFRFIDLFAGIGGLRSSGASRSDCPSSSVLSDSVALR